MTETGSPDVLGSRPWLPYLLVVASGLLVHARSLGYDFTYYDDYLLILENQSFLSDPANLLRVFWQDAFAFIGPIATGVYYRPLLWVSLLLDYQIAGASPAVYHAGNLAIHVLVSCAVYRLLTRLGSARGPALFLSLFFALHPALVPAVAWIPGRNDSLLALFAVLTVLSLLRFLRSQSWGWLLATWAGWAACLFTKESGLVLGVVAPLLALVQGGLAQRSPRVYVLAIGWAAMVPIWLLARHATLGASPLNLSNVLANIPMYFVLIGKTFLPFGLSVLPATTAPLLAMAGVACGFLAFVLWRSRSQLFGRAGVGLLWYLGFLAPSLLAASQSRGLEHRLYVPMIGMLMVLAEVRLSDRWLPGPRARAAAAAALLGVFAVLSIARGLAYADAVAFWERGVRTSSSRGGALETLAGAYFRAGRLEEAEATCRSAMSFGGDRTRKELLLGQILSAMGDLDGASEALGRALAVYPNLIAAWEALADLQERQGEHAAAAASRRKVAELEAMPAPRGE